MHIYVAGNCRNSRIALAYAETPGISGNDKAIKEFFEFFFFGVLNPDKQQNFKISTLG